jgi:thymidylate kinase
MATAPPTLCRGGLLRALFVSLDRHFISYCVLHSWESLPDELPSDLDLAVDSGDARRFPLVTADLKADGYLPIQCFQYAVRGSYFVFAWWEDGNLHTAAIDITLEHRRAGLVLSSSAELLRERRREGLFWIAAPVVEFAYLLDKKVLKGQLSAGHSRRLAELAGELGPERAAEVAARLFGESWKHRVVKACAAGNLGALLRSLRARRWRAVLARDPLNPLRYWAGNLPRLIRRWLRPTGLFLVLLGPDGAGKSSLVNSLLPAIDPVFRRHKHLHSGPLIWPSKEKPVSDPHGQPSYSTWSSVMRLMAHVADHQLGYWVKIRPVLARSGLVLFDRCFLDRLVDARRYRYGGPQWLTRALCRFLPKPELMLVLDAPEDVLLSRKREVSAEDLRRQRPLYRSLLRHAHAGCLIDAAQPPADVLRQAIQATTEYLAARFARRYGHGDVV